MYGFVLKKVEFVQKMYVFLHFLLPKAAISSRIDPQKVTHDAIRNKNTRPREGHDSPFER